MHVFFNNKVQHYNLTSFTFSLLYIHFFSSNKQTELHLTLSRLRWLQTLRYVARAFYCKRRTNVFFFISEVIQTSQPSGRSSPVSPDGQLQCLFQHVSHCCVPSLLPNEQMTSDVSPLEDLLPLSQIASSFYLMEREEKKKKEKNVSMPLSDGQNKLHLQDPNYIV